MGCGASSPASAATAPAPVSDDMSGGSIRKMHANVMGGPVTENTISTPVVAGPATLDGYAQNVFKGKVAAQYLSKHGMDMKKFDDLSWVKDPACADKVAAAVLDWAIERGASSYCHWFQPLAAAFRHGQSAQVQNKMMEFDRTTNEPVWELKGKQLLMGETDGSSYPNGGLRATHTAGGYLTIDPESPIFIRKDNVYVPACFVAFTGQALDERTPMHRAVQALSKEGKRLFKHMGYEIGGMVCNIGLEQELFLIPREQYYSRTDLQLCGRTVMGKMPPRGQEGCDHYMAPINTEMPAMACMQEIQEECLKLGIPLITRHREVAPNQYEFAPMFGTVVSQVDQNLMVMQIMEEVAAKHNLAALLQEKPFAGINGSGKHNNWSIGTTDGVNIFNPGQLTSKSGNHEIFPVIMAATVSAVDKYGDLMRMSIATPGNDFRLGGMEAPPAVMSTYLGESMTQYLTKFMDGAVEEYKPTGAMINLGVDMLPEIQAPAEDRNRTSPFPYGGHRFEFRAVGSSQNVSCVNTVLCGATAMMFSEISAMVEGGKTAVQAAQTLLKDHMKIVFNGNGYDPSWPEDAKAKGLFVIPSQPEAICTISEPKNKEMFQAMGIFQPEEVDARKEVMLNLYTGTCEMEALAMVDMIRHQVAPAAKKAGLDDGEVMGCADEVEKAAHALAGAGSPEECAKAGNVLRLVTMMKARAVCDALESKVPATEWPMASYKELLFLDFHQNSKSAWHN